MADLSEKRHEYDNVFVQYLFIFSILKSSLKIKKNLPAMKYCIPMYDKYF